MKKFNIRVYALIFSDSGEILLTEESHGGKFMRKFPGGGLQWGESVEACLARELKEEFGVELVSSSLFHVTDTAVISFFNPDDQVIAIYYHCEISGDPIALEPQVKMLWVKKDDLQPELCTFASDVRAVELIKLRGLG